MSKQVQIRRGTAEEHKNFTGAIGEITMDTTNKILRLHDGETPGGIPIPAVSNVAVDYVVAAQYPTAENNYTWYRKYKSGWVEQGGRAATDQSDGNATPVPVKIPLAMQDDQYTLTIAARCMCGAATDTVNLAYDNVTPTGFQARSVSDTQATADGRETYFSWCISGMGAQ